MGNPTDHVRSVLDPDDASLDVDPTVSGDDDPESQAAGDVAPAPSPAPDGTMETADASAEIETR